MSDADYLNTRWNDYEKRVRELQVITNKTKEQIIKEGEELTALKIEYKLLDIKKAQISSHLFVELNRLVDSSLESPEFSRRYIQMKVLPEHKQDKELCEIVSHDDEWKEIPTTDGSLKIELDDDDINHFRINGQEFIPKQEPRNKENTQDKTKIIEKDTIHNKWLKEISKVANKINLTADKISEEYNKSDNTQKLIEKSLPNIDKELDKLVQVWAEVSSSKDIIDERRDFSEWAKVMGSFMIEVSETIARISQLMGYSEKYGSIGLLREPKIRAFFETENTYPLYLRSCPNCFVDISQLMSRNIALYRECKKLDIDVPVIKYH